MSKKRFGFILLCFIMAFSIFTIFAADKEILPEDYKTPATGMAKDVAFGEAGSDLYPDGRLQFKIGSWIKINDVDLSLYSSLEITYGAGTGIDIEDAGGNPAYFALSTANTLTGAEPIGKANLVTPEESWSPDNIIAMDIDSDYKGDIYILTNFYNISESPSINVTLLEFVEKPDPNATATPSPSPTATQNITPTPVPTKTATPSPIITKTITPTSNNTSDNNNTPWLIIGIIAGVVVIIAVVTIIVVKKKKK
ncbi:MAG: hypothetical protein LBI03_01000 [Clostridiales bacterium]|nr:hypothetical protein [Clostridiales bacterium]